MRIVIRPFARPGVEIDITHRLTAVIAEAIWLEQGGSDLVNWLEAECHLAQLVPGSADSDPARADRAAPASSQRFSRTDGEHSEVRERDGGVGSKLSSSRVLPPIRVDMKMSMGQRAGSEMGDRDEERIVGDSSPEAERAGDARADLNSYLDPERSVNP